MKKAFHSSLIKGINTQKKKKKKQTKENQHSYIHGTIMLMNATVPFLALGVLLNGGGG